MTDTVTPSAPSPPVSLKWPTLDFPALFPASARLSVLKEKAIRSPEDPKHHRAVARTLLELGRADEAWVALSPTLSMPGYDKDTSLLAGLIACHRNLDAEAADHLSRALNDEPTSVLARSNLAQCLSRLGQSEEALSLLEDGLRLTPGNTELWTTLIRIAIPARQSLLLTRLLHDLAAPDRYIACMDDARVFLAETSGDRRTLESMLLNPDLVAMKDIVDPADPLLAGILSEITAVSEFVANPYDRSVAGGIQAPFPQAPNRPAWGRMTTLIRHHLDAYVNDLRQGKPPFRLPSGDVGWRSWAVRLGSGGRQTMHLHSTGWISGVFYITVPLEVSDATDGSGSLILPLLPHGSIQDWPVRHITPVAGRLVVFPSYMRHATMPFHSNTERVCIAFDVLSTT